MTIEQLATRVIDIEDQLRRLLQPNPNHERYLVDISPEGQVSIQASGHDGRWSSHVITSGSIVPGSPIVYLAQYRNSARGVVVVVHDKVLQDILQTTWV